ncbi:MAG TPA: hypothetical protein EYN66_23740, partial [Myxococcales bacterium]|nr:hypothetical protein [Myxococcales bacterium]
MAKPASRSFACRAPAPGDLRRLATALFLMGLIDTTLAKDGFAAMFWEAAPFILAAMAGSFMGVVLIIPLRKQMLEFERLRFPSGIAVASLLKSPGAG